MVFLTSGLVLADNVAVSLRRRRSGDGGRVATTTTRRRDKVAACHSSSSFLLVLLVLLAHRLGSSYGAKPVFVTDGPVVTLTLKDPNDDEKGGWLDVASMRPNILYGIGSVQPPLPNWFSNLQSWNVRFGYDYQHLPSAPSWLEMTAKLDVPRQHVQIQVQPSHQFRERTTNILLQAVRGAQYAYCQFSRTPHKLQQAPKSAAASPPPTSGGRMFGWNANKSSTGNANTRQQQLWSYQLDKAQASLCWNLPFANLASFRCTGTVLPPSRDVHFQLEATTSTGKTKTILHLEYERPTLAVQYQPDNNHLIRPEIDLYSGKINYQWLMKLRNNGGTVRTSVDPTRAVQISWTDYGGGATQSNKGAWITDIRIPLDTDVIGDASGTTTAPRKLLSANVRVRRQFRF